MGLPLKKVLKLQFSKDGNGDNLAL